MDSVPPPPPRDVPRPQAEVTKAMDNALLQVDEPLDPFPAAAARRILQRSEW